MFKSQSTFNAGETYTEYNKKMNDADNELQKHLAEKAVPKLTSKFYEAIANKIDYRVLPSMIDINYELPKQFKLSKSSNDYDSVVNTCETVALFMREKGFPYKLNTYLTNNAFYRDKNSESRVRSVFT